MGTRLRPITNAMPKPMVPVLNRPVMEHILRLLDGNGFTEAIANLHWFPETIEGRFGDGSELGVDLSYSREEQLLGTSGGVRNAAGFLGDSFLVDLRRRAHRHRPQGDGRVPRIPRRDRDPGDEAGRRHEPVRSRDHRRGRADPGVPGEAPPAEALSDLANCGIYMFRSAIFDYFPEPGTSKAASEDDPPGFADWAMDVFPALLASDAPFYSHEIDRYWNDIGNLEELRQGNLDALLGEVAVEPGAPEVGDGVWAAGTLERSGGQRPGAWGRGSSSARVRGSRGPRSSATAAGSAPGPWSGTRSCSRTPRSRPRACWRGASRPASSRPDSDLTILRATRAPAGRRLGR